MEKTLHVLHLENDPADAELVRKYLVSVGIDAEIVLAPTEESYRQALSGKCFDLVLADHTIPSLDGFVALEIFRTKCGDLPFIFVSRTMGEKFAIESLKKGATDCVRKDKLSGLVLAIARAQKETAQREKGHTAKHEGREKERLWRCLFEDSINAVLLAVDGLVVEGNSQAMHLFDMSREEMTGTNVKKLFDLSDPRTFDGFSQCALEGKFKGELTLVKGGGLKLPGEVSLTEYVDQSGCANTSTIVRDISRHKESDDRMFGKEIRLIGSVIGMSFFGK